MWQKPHTGLFGVPPSGFNASGIAQARPYYPLRDSARTCAFCAHVNNEFTTDILSVNKCYAFLAVNSLCVSSLAQLTDEQTSLQYSPCASKVVRFSAHVNNEFTTDILSVNKCYAFLAVNSLCVSSLAQLTDEQTSLQYSPCASKVVRFSAHVNNEFTTDILSVNKCYAFLAVNSLCVSSLAQLTDEQTSLQYSPCATAQGRAHIP